MLVAILFLGVYILQVISISLLCRKVGFNPLYGVTCFIPYVGGIVMLILLYYIAYAKWPRWQEAGLE